MEDHTNEIKKEMFTLKKIPLGNSTYQHNTNNNTFAQEKIKREESSQKKFTSQSSIKKTDKYYSIK
jgi:hypothetical protein